MCLPRLRRRSIFFFFERATRGTIVPTWFIYDRFQGDLVGGGAKAQGGGVVPRLQVFEAEKQKLPNTCH
jgi:hypothetical protein